MDKQLLEALAALGQVANKELGNVRYRHDLPAGFTVTDNLIHGVGGIFGYPGLDRDVFSTRVKPTGLMAILPAFGSMDDNPIVPYLTGITADEAGTEKYGVCDDPLMAGDIKSCRMGAVFGRYERKTEPIELNAIGRRVNRGEMYDLRIVNDPLLNTSLAVPNMAAPAGNIMQGEFLARILTLGVAMENLIGPQVFTGNPANNTAGGGYEEFVGLETLVGTGKTDVISGTACPSLDSDVKNFNYANVQTNAATLVRVLTTMYRYVLHNATTMGMNPVNWAFVMKKALFYEIADVWPCAYGTYRCMSSDAAGGFTASVNMDGLVQRQMADDMRNGQYLLIDGLKIPVITDDFIPYDTSTTNQNVPEGSFASDIYLLPLTVLGGRAVTFFEFMNFDGIGNIPGGSQVFAAPGGDEFFTSDGGRFLWTWQRTLWCIDWAVKIEPRLRLLTPHLAGRLENVVFSPLQMFREPNPEVNGAANPYWADGGLTSASNAPYSGRDVS